MKSISLGLIFLVFELAWAAQQEGKVKKVSPSQYDTLASKVKQLCELKDAQKACGAEEKAYRAVEGADQRCEKLKAYGDCAQDKCKVNEELTNALNAIKQCSEIILDNDGLVDVVAACEFKDESKKCSAELTAYRAVDKTKEAEQCKAMKVFGTCTEAQCKPTDALKTAFDAIKEKDCAETKKETDSQKWARLMSEILGLCHWKAPGQDKCKDQVTALKEAKIDDASGRCNAYKEYTKCTQEQCENPDAFKKQAEEILECGCSLPTVSMTLLVLGVVISKLWP